MPQIKLVVTLNDSVTVRMDCLLYLLSFLQMVNGCGSATVSSDTVCVQWDVL